MATVICGLFGSAIGTHLGYRFGSAISHQAAAHYMPFVTAGIGLFGGGGVGATFGIGFDIYLLARNQHPITKVITKVINKCKDS